ncbi:ATP-dependent helicase [Litorihabitans aurantiacus]|uniref:ATP-dependent helicase n=1 Tax=Litorihabitans aurantiacus TaxID=1930061 RepID=UPI0024E16163|nr:ATP-dependent DNA helicase [Litorihabitans aurantiacus]
MTASASATPALEGARAPDPAAAEEGARAMSAVVAAVLGGGHHVVLGAPGSGRSTVALEAMAALAGDGGTDDLLLLAPTRRAAGRLRDQLAQRLPVTVGRVLVRTPASFAFSVLRARAALLGEPPPTMLTGADQDAVLTEMLAGHALGVGRDPGWPADVPEAALTLSTFRHELRDLLMRAAEAGWDGPELVRRGERHGRPAWSAAGRVLTEYEEITRLGETTPDRGRRYDVATILDEAVAALAAWEDDLPGHPRPRMRVVVHDDYQDATLATARLLRVLADDGARLLLLGDPDVAVQTFRGAVPALLDRATTGPAGVLGGIAWPSGGRGGRAGRASRSSAADEVVGEFGAEAHVLPTVWRGDDRLRDVVDAVTAGLPALGDVRRRRARPVRTHDPDAPPTSSVTVSVLRSVPEEARAIARTLRTHRLRDGIGWGSMAVLVRASGQVAALRRGLRAGGVPVATAQGEVPLREEPAVRPLLRALALAAAGGRDGEDGDGDLPPEEVTELLLSPIGGLDPVGMRALRRALRGAEAAAGGTRASEELLVEAVLADDVAAEVPHRLRTGLRRVTRVLRAGRGALAQADANLESVLWAVWDATGLAAAWRQRALGTGAAAERADADLDAVLALFRAAESFTARQQGAEIAAFSTYLEAQEFASDTLAATGQRGEAVTVVTAASAAGLEWDVVVVAGVQEDVWPDLRLRARLLDPVGVSDIATGRGDGVVRPVDARRAVLADELRLLAGAVSRTRAHLLVTAVQDADTRPSGLLDIIDPPPIDAEDDRPVQPVPPALDLRGLTAALRREALHPTSSRRAATAGELLQLLAAHAVPGADPSSWWGTAVDSSTRALWSEEEQVRMTPSDLTTLDQCALKWALTSAGGRSGTSVVAELGTLVHGIAADLPHGSEAEMLAELDARWSGLGLADTWPSRLQRRRAENMVRLLAEYVAGVPGAVETEQAFEVTVGRADLTGRVDRVEHLDDGAVRIVDLKTSATRVSVADAEHHPQLAAYQEAVLAGGFPGSVVGGARLAYVDGTAAKHGLRDQAPPTPEDPWTSRLVADSADTMASAAFVATAGPYCGSCPVASSCPAQDAGARVVGP